MNERWNRIYPKIYITPTHSCAIAEKFAIDLQCIQFFHMFAAFYSSQHSKIIHNGPFLCKCLRFSNCNNFHFPQLLPQRWRKKSMYMKSIRRTYAKHCGKTNNETL